MIFKNEKTYDFIKNLALLMPILTTAYGVIGKVWHIPYYLKPSWWWYMNKNRKIVKRIKKIHL